MTRIWLATAPLAFRLKGAGGGTVDNRNQQGFHLRTPKTCPNKSGHLSPRITCDEFVAEMVREDLKSAETNELLNHQDY